MGLFKTLNGYRVSFLKKIFNINDLLVLVAIIIFGVTNVVIKLGLREMSPLSFVGFRMILTSLFMLGLLKAMEKSIGTNRSDFGHFCLLGLFGYTIFHLVFTIGINLTTAAAAAFLMATSPLCGAIIAVLLGLEKVSKKMILGILISLCGVGLLVSKDVPQTFDLANALVGDLLIVGAAFAFTLFTVLAKPALKKNSPLKVNTYSIVTGTIFMIPFTLPSVVSKDWLSLSPVGWFSIVFCVVITAGVSYTLWNRGVAKIGASKTQIYQNLTPVVTASLSIPVLGEMISPLQVLGALIAIIGVYIARRG